MIICGHRRVLNKGFVTWVAHPASYAMIMAFYENLCQEILPRKLYKDNNNVIEDGGPKNIIIICKPTFYTNTYDCCKNITINYFNSTPVY